MRHLSIPGQLVEKEPLRSNRVLGINAPPTVGHNGRIDWSHDATPSPGAHPQSSLCIPASRRDIHPVLPRLLEYHTVARRLKIPKTVRPPSDLPFFKLVNIRVRDMLNPHLDLSRHGRGDDQPRIKSIAHLKVGPG